MSGESDRQTMADLKALEQAVEALEPSALAEFRRWFAAFDAAAWDRQLEDDTTAGKLDAFWRKRKTTTEISFTAWLRPLRSSLARIARTQPRPGLRSCRPPHGCLEGIHTCFAALAMHGRSD
jgi:hypothetical protein